MVLSSLFILSPRGDAIISKDFRGDVPKSSIETFFRRVKLDKDAAPVLVRARCVPALSLEPPPVAGLHLIFRRRKRRVCISCT